MPKTITTASLLIARRIGEKMAVGKGWCEKCRSHLPRIKIIVRNVIELIGMIEDTHIMIINEDIQSMCLEHIEILRQSS
jgi:hypothetical protein